MSGEYVPVWWNGTQSEPSSGNETMSEESGTFEPVQDDLSSEPDSERPRESGESRNITHRLELNDEESRGSIVDSRPQS